MRAFAVSAVSVVVLVFIATSVCDSAPVEMGSCIPRSLRGNFKDSLYVTTIFTVIIFFNKNLTLYICFLVYILLVYFVCYNQIYSNNIFFT